VEATEQLLPCPFCGETRLGVHRPVMGVFVVCCHTCRAQGPAVGWGQEAIALWNQRVALAAVRAGETNAPQ
jgi:Lar family restriction alleviation protein